LRDARKLGLLPSVTTILRILHKEGLEKWKIEQAVLAVVTSPRQPGEKDDDFIRRILHEEEVHEQEGRIARDKGTEIHDALDFFLGGMQVDAQILAWIAPAAEAVKAFGAVVTTETNLVGPGFAGKSDAIQEADSHWSISDFKSAKKLPDPAKGAWMEHRLQLAAYAKAFTNHELYRARPKPIVLRNVYISTINEGEFVICEHEEAWQEVYGRGFAPLVLHWQWATGYTPPGMPTENIPYEDRPVVPAPKEPSQVLVQSTSIPKMIESSVLSAPAPTPIASPPQPAPSNGPPSGRKTVVTHGVRLGPAGTPMPLPPAPPRNQ
jgi:hypothetical protein